MVEKKQLGPVTFYVLGSNGALKTSSFTRYFPFSEKESGYTAQERARTAESEALDMIFDNGMFTTEDPLQIEILMNHHTGCTINTPGKYKGKILRASNNLLCTITDRDPAKVSAEIAALIAGNTGVQQNLQPVEVVVNKIPRIMVDSVDVTVLMSVLKKEKGIELKLPMDKDEVISILEKENLISD